MFGLFKKSAPQPARKIRMAKKAPQRSPNGTVATIPQRREVDNEEEEQPRKQDTNLAEWISYQFGNEVPLERITRISEEDILHFLAMKLQTRLCSLNGIDDPDLQESMLQDYMEMMISEDGEGRREMNEIIAAGITMEKQSDPDAKLFGKL